MEHKSIVERYDPVPLSIQEVQLQPIDTNLLLFQTLWPRNNGIFSLKILPPERNIQQFIAESEMIDNKQNDHLTSFINEAEGQLEPKYHTWSVQMKDYLDISVEIQDQANCRVNFDNVQDLNAQQERVPRQCISSRPFSRLNDCASVEFTIFVGCRETCSKRFRLVAQSDLERNYKDYNVLFSRKAPEPVSHGSSQLVVGYGNDNNASMMSFQGRSQRL